MFLWDVIVLGIPAVLGAVLAVLFALVQFRMLFFAQSAGYSARKTLRLLFDRAGQMFALPTVVTLATIFAAAFSFAAPNNTVSSVAMLIWIYAVPGAAIVLRSDVPVGYTARIRNRYPDLDIAFVPDFAR